MKPLPLYFILGGAALGMVSNIPVYHNSLTESVFAAIVGAIAGASLGTLISVIFPLLMALCTILAVTAAWTVVSLFIVPVIVLPIVCSRVFQILNREGND